MCATYGLEAGDRDGVAWDLPPLDLWENAERIADWARNNANTARITGRHARNLNPLIRAPQGRRRLEFAWWWLHIGNEPARFSAFNSRDDKLMAKWRRPFQDRALLPATWYIEKGARFALPGGPLFAMAAITTTATLDDGDELTTYSLVTRDAVAEARTVHPRMPLILPAELHDTWLDPERPGDEDLVIEAVAASEDLSHQAHIIDRPTRASQKAPTLF